jgi:hypothetical protein
MSDAGGVDAAFQKMPFIWAARVVNSRHAGDLRRIAIIISARSDSKSAVRR